MIAFKDLPIRRKLTRLSMVVSASVLLLSCAAFIGYELLTFKNTAAEHLSTNAEIVGINVTPALLFQDQRAAAETLAAFRATPNIVSAAVYTPDGNPFAKYVRGYGSDAAALPDKLDVAPSAHRIESGYLIVLKQILSDGKPVGMVYIQSDLREMESRLRVYAAIAFSVLTASFIVALLVSSILERKISGPILSLAETTKTIALKKDYSVRTAIESKDEIGILSGSFNEMLRQIEERNETLQESIDEQKRAEEKVRQLNAGLERRVAERTAELRESREQFRALAETANDAIVSADGSGRITYFNQAASKIFGHAADDAIGRPLTLLMPERFQDAHRGGMTRYLSTGETRVVGRTTELTGRRKDAAEFPMELSLASWRSGDGTFFTGIIRDITERKRIESTLQEKNVELANAMKAKDRFLASMSHELRTPLNAIIGFTGTLLLKLPGPLNADQEKQLRTVQTGAKHLLSLINDLLDVAKIEAEKVELNLAAVDCAKVIEEIAASLRPQAGAKGLEFTVTTPKQGLNARTDRRALSQIIINLVNNAIKFTERGSVRLRAERRGEGAGQALEISVDDTGTGIRTEDQSKLFAAFSRVNAPGKETSEGTGLGLHLSQKLAEALGGKIELKSEYGKGSTFTLVLPEK